MFYIFEENEDKLGREVILLTSQSISKPKNGAIYIESNDDYSNGCYILENSTIVDVTPELDQINLNKKKSELLKELKQTTKRIYKYECLGISKLDEDPNFKIQDYKQKYDWALLKKSQIDNGDTNIDYSLYHEHAVIFNSLCSVYGITETDIDIAYVLLVIKLHGIGIENLSKISLNEYSIEKAIKDAVDQNSLNTIKENMETDLKQGLNIQ